MTDKCEPKKRPTRRILTPVIPLVLPVPADLIVASWSYLLSVICFRGKQKPRPLRAGVSGTSLFTRGLSPLRVDSSIARGSSGPLPHSDVELARVEVPRTT